MAVSSLGKTPINSEKLKQELLDYPNHQITQELVDGFSEGFPLHYQGIREDTDCLNLGSVRQNVNMALKKVQKEVDLGRVAGPFKERPLPNLRLSPLGLIPKSTPGEFRLIHHLSHPKDNSVNSGIDSDLCSVQYTKFDAAIELVQNLGQGALLAKSDIKSAFRLLPISPQDFDLLGFKLQGYYYFDKCLPMGCSLSCSLFEKFSSALEWIVQNKSGKRSVLHYLDDFLFGGKAGSTQCKDLLECFLASCENLGVPIAEEKTLGPCTVLCFLGLEIDTVNLTIKIPAAKVVEICEKLENVFSKQKVTLREMQSLIGALHFACRAVRPGRTFCRRLINSIKGLTQPHHRIRVTGEVKQDIEAWLYFFKGFNGVSVFLNKEWESSQDLCLYTDSAGGPGMGFGAFFNGKWCFGVWPVKWHDQGLTRSITLLEFFPILVAIVVWGELLTNKKILFRSDNTGVVSIINSLTSKSDLVMKLVRSFVLRCLKFNILCKCSHIPGADNTVADSISRLQWDRFFQLAPGAEREPHVVPNHLWEIFN